MKKIDADTTEKHTKVLLALQVAGVLLQLLQLLAAILT